MKTFTNPYMFLRGKKCIVETAQNAIQSIRKLRKLLKIPKKQKMELTITCTNDRDVAEIMLCAQLIMDMVNIDPLITTCNGLTFILRPKR